jgi:hypothetical protein
MYINWPRYPWLIKKIPLYVVVKCQQQKQMIRLAWEKYYFTNLLYNVNLNTKITKTSSELSFFLNEFFFQGKLL